MEEVETHCQQINMAILEEKGRQEEDPRLHFKATRLEERKVAWILERYRDRKKERKTENNERIVGRTLAIREQQQRKTN